MIRNIKMFAVMNMSTTAVRFSFQRDCCCTAVSDARTPRGLVFSFVIGFFSWKCWGNHGCGESLTGTAVPSTAVLESVLWVKEDGLLFDRRSLVSSFVPPFLLLLQKKKILKITSANDILSKGEMEKSWSKESVSERQNQNSDSQLH